MARNVDFEISFFEILSIIKHNWKSICIITLLCVAVCGGYKVISSDDQQTEPYSYSDYETDMESYDYFLETQGEMPNSLKREWENVCRDRFDNPIFALNPYDCEYEQIVIRFGDKPGNNWTVSNWISESDNQKLFGSQEKLYSRFKSTIIIQNQDLSAGNAVVNILAVDKVDVDAATNYLMKHFEKCATRDDVTIEGMTCSRVNGYNDFLYKYQRRNRDEINSIYGTFQNSGNMKQFIVEPQNPIEEESNKVVDIIKYCVLGLVLGLIVGIGLNVVRVIRRRVIISPRQIENAFNLELLSDCSSGSEVALDVLNANLDIMTGENSSITLIAEQSIKELMKLASEWTEKSDHKFIACTDIFDNPGMIESLKSTNGIILGVELGRSKLEQLQRIILRANKLEQTIVGFVLI